MPADVLRLADRKSYPHTMWSGWAKIKMCVRTAGIAFMPVMAIYLYIFIIDFVVWGLDVAYMYVICWA